MKDPIVLCPYCRQPSRRIRKLDGIRCITEHCTNKGMTTCADAEMKRLRVRVKEYEMLEWAKSCQR